MPVLLPPSTPDSRSASLHDGGAIDEMHRVDDSADAPATDADEVNTGRLTHGGVSTPDAAATWLHANSTTTFRASTTKRKAVTTTTQTNGRVVRDIFVVVTAAVVVLALLVVEPRALLFPGESPASHGHRSDQRCASGGSPSSQLSSAPMRQLSRRKAGVLNVHVVPHSHDDVGWLKTVDQYYVGANASIQSACVRHVINTVVDALAADPNKTFTYAEMAYFHRWWREQTAARRALVTRLVRQNRLSFANGGWCMHDEAAAHYADMIDQTTLGHAFIAKHFGSDALPRVGWQLDPFGHSAIQATHLGSGVGFEAVFFGRADQDDVDARSKRGAMEFTWRGSASLGRAADVKGFILSRYGNYGPPPGHCYDQVCTDPVWQDDPTLEDYNVAVMVERFEAAVREQAGWFRGADAGGGGGFGGDVMLTMGTDFTYSAANYWFDQLDRLIENVNAHAGDRLNVFYSSPGAYLDAKKANPDMAWPLKTGDFFPYKWDEHQYWTGYYTSRPTLKRFIRRGGEYLRAARTLAAALSIGAAARAKTAIGALSPLRILAEAMGVAQHHDAVSGTAKQHVTDDYALRVSAGLAAVEPKLVGMMIAALAKPLDGGSPPPPPVTPRMSQCPLLNVSACPATETLEPGQALVILVYNPLATARSEHVRLPVSFLAAGLAAVASDGGKKGSGLRVVDGETGKVVPSSILPASEPRAPGSGAAGGAQLAFAVSTPPLSITTLFVEAHVASPEGEEPIAGLAREATVSEGAAADALEAPCDECRTRTSAHVDASTGALTLRHAWRSEDSPATVTVNVTVSLAWYRSHAGDDGFTPSGAYVFRPDASNRANLLKPSGVTRVVKSPVVTELRQRYGDWASLTTRLWAGEAHAEVEWTVGPIPVEADGVGKEIVVRYATGLKTNGRWATDANGRDMQVRRRDHRDDWTLNVTEPVAGNYVPCGSVASLSAEDADAALHLMPDRSQGVASIADGELEAMVHRRVLRDDNLGVGEPLNETQCGCVKCACEGLTARGVHLVTATTQSLGPRTYRALQQRAETPLVMAFASVGDVSSGPEAWTQTHETSVSLLAGERSVGLPENVHLLSFEPVESADCFVGATCVLVRLAHMFEANGSPGWDLELSSPAKVDLRLLFPDCEIVDVRETLLSGVIKSSRAPGNGAVDTVVTLGPMEIRAMRVTLKPSRR